MSNHWYNEWLGKVKIGMWSINWSPHCIFLSQVGKKLAIIGLHPPFILRLSGFGLIQAIHISLTLPMSHHKHNEWSHKVEIGIHLPQPSQHLTFESQVEAIFRFKAPTFHTKIVWVRID